MMKRSEHIFWWIFLIWSGVGLVVLGLGLGPQWIKEQVAEGGLRDFLLAVERMGDAVWMCLAGLLLFLRAARASGGKRAGLAFALVAILSGAIEYIGVVTGHPFGPYRYTDRFGPLYLSTVPWAIPVAWWVVVEGSRAVASALGARGWAALLLAVMFAVLTDINLEPVAWKIRGYWEWYPGTENPPAHPPFANYLTWAIVAGALIALCARCGVRRPDGRGSAAVLLVVNLFFLVARLGD